MADVETVTSSENETPLEPKENCASDNEAGPQVESVAIAMPKVKQKRAPVFANGRTYKGILLELLCGSLQAAPGTIFVVESSFFV